MFTRQFSLLHALAIVATLALGNVAHAASEPAAKPKKTTKTVLTAAKSTKPIRLASADEEVPTGAVEGVGCEGGMCDTATAPAVPAPIAEGSAPCSSCGDSTCCGGCDSCTSDCNIASECGMGCDSCCRPLTFIGGAEATFLWPHLKRTDLTTSFSSLAQPGVDNFSSGQTTVDGKFIAAPRVWLGVQGCKWGFLGRYWNATSWSSTLQPFAPGITGNQLVASDNFRAYLADMEITRRFQVRWSDIYASFGVRYGSITNNTILASNGVQGLDLVQATALSNQQFNGTGITMGTWGTLPFWRDCCEQSCFKFFWSGRTSVLWGNGGALAQTSASVLSDFGNAASFNGALARGGETLFIGEFQLGTQWDRQLKYFPGRAFLRMAFEYQYWDTTTGARAVANSVALTNTSTVSAFATGRDLLFNLVGFSLGAGITF